MRRLRERLSGDRGGVAVAVALLMVPLLGFAALAIDVAAAYLEQHQLQTGADAAALAIAEECARGACPGDPVGTATSLVRANDDNAAGPAVTWPTANRVTVTAPAERQHWFAPVLGIDSSRLGARATVAWGYPTAGTALLPLILTKAEFEKPITGVRTIELSDPKKNDVPGGFGWLAAEDKEACMVATSVGLPVEADPGASPSNGCEPADFEAVQGRTILLPVYDNEDPTQFDRQDKWYVPAGYAAFRVTGYKITGHYEWQADACGNKRCIRGEFVRFVDHSGAFDYDTDPAHDFGAAVVSLLADSELDQ